MTSLDYFAQEKLKKISEEGKLRSLNSFVPEDAKYVLHEGKKLISFASNDYLGMASNELVKKAAKNAIDQYGVGAKSARLICGNSDIYGELEGNLAKYKNAERAVVFGSGYLSAIGVIPALVGRRDLVVADKFIHSSLLDGIALSGAALKRYNHNDYEHCNQILERERKNYQNCLIISETIFSMDGDFGDIEKLSILSEKFSSWLLTDDAHGFGIVGSAEVSKNIKDSYIQLGTLSKAIGSYGGYIAASNDICNYIITKAKSFIYTTALPHPVIAAANKAVEIIREDKTIIEKLKNNISLFASQLQKTGQEGKMLTKEQDAYRTNKKSPIFIVEMDSIEELNKCHQKLIDGGFYAGRIRPPTSKTPRLRITISATHEEQEIKKLCFLLVR